MKLLSSHFPDRPKYHIVVYHCSILLDVCMYLYIYIHMYVCIYIYIYIYVCLSVCLSGCLAVWLSGCLAGCLSVCTYVCMHVCITVCKYINIEKRHVRVCMYIYIYIHIHRIVSHQIHIYKSTHICWGTPSISITAARLAGRRQLHWQLRRDPPHEAVGDATQNTRTIARVLVKRPWNSQSSWGCLGIHGGTQGDIYIYIYTVLYIYIYVYMDT